MCTHMYMFCYKHAYKPHFYEYQDFLRIIFKTTCASGLHRKKKIKLFFFAIVALFCMNGNYRVERTWSVFEMTNQWKTNVKQEKTNGAQVSCQYDSVLTEKTTQFNQHWECKKKKSHLSVCVPGSSPPLLSVNEFRSKDSNGL